MCLEYQLHGKNIFLAQGHLGSQDHHKVMPYNKPHIRDYWGEIQNGGCL